MCARDGFLKSSFQGIGLCIAVVLVVGPVETVQNFVTQIVIWDLFPKPYPKTAVFNPKSNTSWDSWEKSFEQAACSKVPTFEQVCTGCRRVLHNYRNITKF
jgi:hypothetical protein